MVSRAERLIAEADVEAEKLIGFVRIAMALVLGITTFVLVQNADMANAQAEAGIRLASSAITGWFVLGVMSFSVVQFGFYKPWMAWAFGLCDVALVTANLALPIVVGGLSSLLALSTPAAFMVAILFVLQTLRYRQTLQLGLSILLLCILALLVFARPSPVADVSLEGLLASRFDVIPNIARVVLLGIVAAIASFAVWQSRKLLHQVARETELRVNQTRFMPAELATRMTDAELTRMREGRLSDLVIMFVDVRGFTAMSEKLTPVETNRFLSEFRSLVTDAVLPHEGVVDKFIGDGALIVFGLRSPIEQAAQASITAGTSMLHAVEDWNRARREQGEDPIRIVVALHAGKVLSGAIGDMRRLEFSIVGSPVNEASRIESLAKERNLPMVASSSVLDRLEKRPCEFSDLGEERLRGRTDPVRLWGYSPPAA